MRVYNANGVKFSDKRRLIIVAFVAGLITGVFLIPAFFPKASFGNREANKISPSSISKTTTTTTTTTSTSIQLEAILHYATSKVVPQQTLNEIMESFNVLRELAPCNFLVYGLGYDSLMWASLNPNGTTLFLEESPEWVNTVLKGAPYLHAETITYRTHLFEADKLLETYQDEPDCHPSKAFLKGNSKCRLALESLPDEVYEKEWDVIMIDAPRGYQPGYPGRMAAIYSAAVMARARKSEGNTHVYLHDVDRKVEKLFAQEFLCIKYKVGSVGKLWHFEIPPSRDNSGSSKFC